MEYNYRKAQESDIPFLVQAIIEAEKSGSNLLSLAAIFNLTEEKLKNCLIEIFHIETKGCEFSLDSFFVVEFQGEPIAALATWIESRNDQNSCSAITKSNLIGYVFPKTNLESIKRNSTLFEIFNIEREKDSRQIEYVFVAKEHRGKKLVNKLIDIACSGDGQEVKKTQIQLWANNIAALKTYKNSGFKITKEIKSEHKDTLQYYPCNTKLLVERFIGDNIS